MVERSRPLGQVSEGDEGGSAGKKVDRKRRQSPAREQSTKMDVVAFRKFVDKMEKGAERRRAEVEGGASTLESSSAGPAPEADDDAAAAAVLAAPRAPGTPKTPPPSVPEEEKDELLPTPQVPGPSQFPMSPPRRPFMLDEESDLESMAEEVDEEAEIPSFLDLLRRSGRRGRRAREDEEDGEQRSEEGGGDEENQEENHEEAKEFVKQEEEDQDMYAPEEEANDGNSSNDMDVDDAHAAQAQAHDDVPLQRSPTRSREEASIPPPPAQPTVFAKQEPMDVAVPPKERQKKKKKKKRSEDVDPTTTSGLPSTTTAPTASSLNVHDGPSQSHTAASFERRPTRDTPVSSSRTDAISRSVDKLQFKPLYKTTKIDISTLTEETPRNVPRSDSPGGVGGGRQKSTTENEEPELEREILLPPPLNGPQRSTTPTSTTAPLPATLAPPKAPLTSTFAATTAAPPPMSASQSTRPRPRPIVSPLKRKRVEIINLDSSGDELGTEMESGSMSKKKSRVEAPRDPFISTNGSATANQTARKTSTSDTRASGSITAPLAYTRSESHWQLDGSLLVQLDGVRYNLHRSRLVRVCGWFRGVLEDVTRSSLVGTSPRKKGEGKKDIKGKGKAKQVEGGVRTKEQEERELALAKRRQRKLREKHLVYESVEGDERVVVRLDGLGLGRDEWEVLLDCLDDFVRFMNPEHPLPFHVLSLILVASYVLDAKDYYVWAKRGVESMWIPSAVTSGLAGVGMRPPSSSQAPFASQVPYASQRVRPSPTRTTNDRSLAILDSITPVGIPHAVETVLIARRCRLDKGVLKRALYEVMRREGFGMGSGGGVESQSKKGRGVKHEEGEGLVNGYKGQEEEGEDDDCVVIDDPGVAPKSKEREGSEEEEKKVALGMDDVARLVYARSRMFALWSEVLKCGEWDRCFGVGSEGRGGGSEPGTTEGGSTMPAKLPKATRVSASTPKVFQPTPGFPMPGSLLRKFAQASQATASTSSQVSQSQPTTASQAQSPPGSQSTSQTSQTQETCPSRVPGKVYEIHHRLIISSDVFETYMNDPICGYKALVGGDVDWEGEGFCQACCDTRREVWTKTCERRWRDLDELLVD